jgi:hypothetical protein
MSGQRRLRASWLLAVLFTSISLGVCTPLFGDDAPCCPDVVDEASFSVCCHTGDEPSSEVPPGVQGLVPPTATAAFQVSTYLTTYGHSLFVSTDNSPHRSADLQTLLSTFLI